MPSGNMTSVKIDTRWIGLQGYPPPDLINPNEPMATVIKSAVVQA